MNEKTATPLHVYLSLLVFILSIGTFKNLNAEYGDECNDMASQISKQVALYSSHVSYKQSLKKELFQTDDNAQKIDLRGKIDEVNVSINQLLRYFYIEGNKFGSSCTGV